MTSLPQKETKVYIYGLHNGDGVIRYVGSTSDLQRRMWTHRRNQKIYTWLDGKPVCLKTLATVEPDNRYVAEQRAILMHRNTIVNIRHATSDNALSEQEHKDMLSSFFDSIGE